MQALREVRATQHSAGGRGLQEGQISPEPGHRRPQVKWKLLLLTALNINNGEIDEIPKFRNKSLVLFRGSASRGQTCLLVSMTTHEPSTFL